MRDHALEGRFGELVGIRHAQAVEDSTYGRQFVDKGPCARLLPAALSGVDIPVEDVPRRVRRPAPPTRHFWRQGIIEKDRSVAVLEKLLMPLPAAISIIYDPPILPVAFLPPQPHSWYLANILLTDVSGPSVGGGPKGASEAPRLVNMVEDTGLEPVASTMPLSRSPS